MNKLISLLVALVLVVSIFVGAQVVTSTLPDPGTLPDSPFYFLKSWREGIQLFFTFGAESKAEQYLHLAEVRLAEYEKMLEKGKEEIAERTLEKYENQLNHALEKAKELKEKGEEVADELWVKTKEVATKRLVVLRENLEKVPESAKEGIERALEAAQDKFFGYYGEGDDVVEINNEDVSTVPSDWKTYRNEQYGFEFKLPAEYSSTRKDEINGDDYSEDYRHKNNSSEYFSVGVISSSRIRQNTLTLTGKDYSKRPITLENLVEEQRSYNTYLSSEIKNKTQTTIASYSAIKQEEKAGHDAGVDIYTVTYVLKDGNLIKLIGSDDMSEEEYNQIISTFKFTELGSTAGTSNWQTYRNERLGVEFKHPANWFVLVAGENAVDVSDYDVNDPRYERGNPNGTKIQFVLSAVAKNEFSDVITNENIAGIQTEFGKTGENENVATYKITEPSDGNCYYLVLAKKSNQRACVFVWFRKANIDQILSTFKFISQ